MSFMDDVNRIKEDMAKLPTNYRKLLAEEKSWVQAHPHLYALGLFLAGVVVGLFF